jgi:hypothetical protein
MSHRAKRTTPKMVAGEPAAPSGPITKVLGRKMSNAR